MEYIYAVERNDLFKNRFPHGFLPSVKDHEEELCHFLNQIEYNGFFIQRSPAEKRSQFKQIIPYIFLVYENRLFEVKRRSSQEEERLHGMASLGLGGHINPVDESSSSSVSIQSDITSSLPSVLKTGFERELEEEAKIDTTYSAEFAGIINDDTNEVGTVHFGAVFRVELDKPNIEIRESDKMVGSFQSLDQLLEKQENAPESFETWSYHLLEHPDFLIS